MALTGAFTGSGVKPTVTNAYMTMTNIVRVTFSEPMDPVEVAKISNYTITEDGTARVLVLLSTIPENYTSPNYVDIILNDYTIDGTLYTVVASTNIEDLAGNPLEDAAQENEADFFGFGLKDALEEVGIIEALTEIIGEQDTEIGGHRITRLTTVANAGATTIAVEVTEGWAASGKLGIDGVLYTYTGKTATTFTGIQHVAAGNTVDGCIIQHRVESPVVDRSLQWSAVELARRALLVNYAEGDYLSSIGRNLGVNRLPIYRTDDQFRDVIKAVAYNPKGTIYGLDLALEAMVGAGNYEIYEDLLQFNNTVFIRLLGSMLTETISEGKAFLQSLEYPVTAGSSDQLTLSLEPISVQSVMLYDLDRVFSFATEIPGDVQYPYYPEATPADAFAYTGSQPEGTAVTLPAGENYTQFATSAGSQTVLYEMDDVKGARITSETFAVVSALIQVPTGGALTSNDPEQTHIHLHDGSKKIGVGIISNASDIEIGLYKPGDTVLTGSTVVVPRDEFHEITLIKNGIDPVRLEVNGQFISEVGHWFFDGDTERKIEFGIGSTIVSPVIFHIKQLSVGIKTDTEYWSLEKTGGTTAGGVEFDTNIVDFFTSADVGKRFDIWGHSTNPASFNPQGGNNNGSWIIESIPADPSQLCNLVGPDRTDAIVESANPTRITVPEGYEFTYPDDLGQNIIIENSEAGNDGTYLITALLQEGTFADFSTFDTPLTEKTRVCVCASATFTSEVGLDWHLQPVMTVYGASLSWRLSDAGSFSGTTLTLREALWGNDLIMLVRFSDVLSAQLLEDAQVANLQISPSPVLFEYYPFYVYDPLGIVQEYLTTITAAGVIPDFELA